MTTSFLLDIFVLSLPPNVILAICFFLYSMVRPGWTFLINMHFFSLTTCYYAHWEEYFYNCNYIPFFYKVTNFLP